jgi:acyl-coenzyme A synthetase/AMP-(fatty) acid ligase
MITVGEFLRSAHELARRLPRRAAYCVNLCKDRYHFLLGFAAALLSRHVNLLPTSRAEDALTQLLDRYPDSYILADHDEGPPDPRLYRMPERLSPGGRQPDIPVIPSDQVAAVVFTSGSTGLPRAHRKTWGSLVNGADALRARIPFGDGPFTALGTVPPQHMYGLETTIMLPLRSGWSLHSDHPILPADMEAAMREACYPVWLMTTPTHLRAYVSRRTGLAHLSGILSATMPLDRTVAKEAERIWRVPLYEIYGCTEGGAIGSRRTIIDEQWTLCPQLSMLQEGDSVWVSGGHVGSPVLLADRINVRADGAFALAGRSSDLIKIAGKRASLSALNAALTQIKGVVDGSFYRPSNGHSDDVRLMAFVVAPGMSAATIRSELRKRIDPLFLPRPLRLVDALPRNAMGKLPRDAFEAFAATAARDGRRRG